MPSKRLFFTAAPIAIVALAGMGLATAQSSSPFAAKSRAQAWEQQPAATASPQTWQLPAQNTAPQNTAYQAPPQPVERPAIVQVPASEDAPIAMRPRSTAKMQSYSAKTPPKTFGGQGAPRPQNYGTQALAGSPNPPQGSEYVYTPPPVRVAQAADYGSAVPPTGQAQPQNPPTSGSPYAPGTGRRVQAWETQSAPQTAPSYGTPTPPQQGYQSQGYETPSYPAQGLSYPVQANGGPSQTPPTGYVPNGYTQNGYTPNGYTPNGPTEGYQSSVPPTGAPYPSGPYAQAPQQPRSWTEKLGLKNIATLIRGKFTAGGAATYREQPPNQIGPNDGWSDDEILSGELDFEISAITDGGLEYGVALGARAQYDPFRRGFGGQLPECPAGTLGCSGTVTGLRGHTSGFYSGGEDITKDAQVALESAHLFLRSAYGDVTIGRDDGAAYLFSLGAPTLLAVGASNSPVDYTGYDSVKTVNDASGFAEKVTYTTPRLLGDQIGLGVQLGVSYALDGDVCGVDYCNGKNIDGILQPEIEDILEVGLALDRTFGNGLHAELTGTYARGSEKTGDVGFDDLESYGAGLEFEYGKWTLGGSYLQSNNGLLNGDYTAYDAGLTWKPGALGFTLGYGHAEDDNVGLTSDQGTFGITYDFNDKFTLGTGVQYVDRDVNGVVEGLPVTLDQRATSVFVQGGFKF